MSTATTKRVVSPWCAAGAALVLGAALPAGMSFVPTCRGIVFPLIGLWCCCALFYGVLWALRLAGIRLRFFHWAVLTAAWAAALVYFCCVLGNRDFVYIWDYANYLLRQTAAEAAFARSTAAGLAFIAESLAEDYTNFITLFTEFPFCLSDHTGDSYALCQVFCILPSLMVALAGLVIQVGRMLRVRNELWYFLIGFSWTLTYPFLRMSALLAQPDWLGLVFAFCILVLTLDYRFDRLEPGRCALIFLATAAVILTRRWYLYFVVGYYAAYALLITVSSLRLARQGDRRGAARRLGHLLLFGLCSLAAMVALLWPMVSHILAYDYTGRYAYYNFGGLALELLYHAGRLGGLNILLILPGIGLAKKRRLPALPCLAAGELCLSFFLFTRVQNTGSHQFLLFLPGYFLLFLAGAAALAESIRRRRALKLGFWGLTIVLAVWARCSPLTTVALPGVLVDHFPLHSTDEFERLDRLTCNRDDLEQIQAIAQWIDTHCAEGEFSYMIPHDMLYCPDHFKNCQLPETPLEEKLAHGFSIPGTHSFPMEFFEAKYVLTADPFPQTFVNTGELSGRFNAAFLERRDETFALAAQFDMGNGTIFTVWERTTAPTRDEVEYYLSVFAEESAAYPELFVQTAERWLAARGL